MERTHRKVFQGVVVSDKMDKTIVVSVAESKKYGMYGKRVKNTKKFVAHDENNEAGIGDTVLIMETRPLSATKRYRLVKVVEKAIVL
jgi:small subunit ribosomal protein S17